MEEIVNFPIEITGYTIHIDNFTQEEAEPPVRLGVADWSVPVGLTAGHKCSEMIVHV